MFIYQQRKYIKQEVFTIFQKYSSRSQFILDYTFWGEDDNYDFYEEFIDNSIVTNITRYQKDAIELSLRIHVYKSDYLECIRKILHSKKNYLIKLSCLDWFSEFIEEILEDIFNETNLYVLNTSKNELLKLQAVLNLLQSDPDKSLLKKLFRLLIQSRVPATFYRLFNNIYDDNKTFNLSVIDEMKAKLPDIISKSTVLTDAQRLELITLCTKLL